MSTTLDIPIFLDPSIEDNKQDLVMIGPYGAWEGVDKAVPIYDKIQEMVISIDKTIVRPDVEIDWDQDNHWEVVYDQLRELIRTSTVCVFYGGIPSDSSLTSLGLAFSMRKDVFGFVERKKRHHVSEIRFDDDSLLEHKLSGLVVSDEIYKGMEELRGKLLRYFTH